jgi:hypothetical protein
MDGNHEWYVACEPLLAGTSALLQREFVGLHSAWKVAFAEGQTLLFICTRDITPSEQP